MTAVNAFGRQVIDYLTNKSGGGVIAGDVVVIDTSNDQAFTTNTAGAFTGGVGVAQETIANNAAGRVLRFGYAALVNVNASVTRGQYGKTHTVAKQATGSASRTIGTFCQFLTGGTSPTATLFPVDLLGTSLSNPMTTTGDIIYSSDGSGTPARLGVGTAAQVLVGGTLPAWGTVTALTYTSAAASADSSIPNTSTYTDVTGCTASLGAGTYIAWVTVDCSTASANALFVHLKVINSTDTVEYAVDRYTLNGTGVSGEDTFSLVVPAFTIAGTKTVKLQAASNVAFTVLRRTTGLNANTTDSSRIVFLRVA